MVDKSKYDAYYDYRSTAPAKNVASSNVSGIYAVESHNVENAHFPYRITQGRNIFNVGGSDGNTEIYDVVDGGGPELHHVYGVNGIAINTEQAYLSCHIPNCNHVFYCFYAESCSYCF